MKFEVRVKRLNESESSFITKDYDNYNPVIKKVNGLEQSTDNTWLAVIKLVGGAIPPTSPCTNGACYNKLQ